VTHTIKKSYKKILLIFLFKVLLIAFSCSSLQVHYIYFRMYSLAYQLCFILCKLLLIPMKPEGLGIGITLLSNIQCLDEGFAAAV